MFVHVDTIAGAVVAGFLFGSIAFITGCGWLWSFYYKSKYGSMFDIVVSVFFIIIGVILLSLGFQALSQLR